MSKIAAVLVGTLAGLALLYVVSGPFLARADAPVVVRPTFEYRIVDLSTSGLDKAQSLLNQAGAEGWDLVSVGNWAFFRRQR